jgi:hypothetical protein
MRCSQWSGFENVSVARVSPPLQEADSTAIILNAPCAPILQFRNWFRERTISGLAFNAPRNDWRGYGCRAEAVMIAWRVATYRENALRPSAVALTVVCGFLPTKDFSTAT